MKTNPNPSAGRKRSSLARKLGFSFAVAGAVATIVAAGVSYFTGRNALEKSTFGQMNSVREVLQKQVQTYLENARNDLASLAESPLVIEGLGELSAARARLKTELAA